MESRVWLEAGLSGSPFGGCDLALATPRCCFALLLSAALELFHHLPHPHGTFFLSIVRIKVMS